MQTTTRPRYAFRPTKIPPRMRALDDYDALRQAAQAAGSHFFDRDTMRFFGSRLGHIIYAAPNGSAVFFTTSERDTSGFGRLGQAWGGKRRHTVRLARFIRGRLHIDTKGDFGAYASANAAYNAARRLARGGA